MECMCLGNSTIKTLPEYSIVLYLCVCVRAYVRVCLRAYVRTCVHAYVRMCVYTAYMYVVWCVNEVPCYTL